LVGNFKAVTTQNDASATVVELWLQATSTYTYYLIFPFIHENGSAVITFYSSQSWDSALPAGTQTDCGTNPVVLPDVKISGTEIDMTSESGTKVIYMGGHSSDQFGIAYSSDYPNYGIFYKEAAPDYVAISPGGGGVSTPDLKVDGDGNIYIKNNTYFANGTTYYISNTGSAKFSGLSVHGGNPVFYSSEADRTDTRLTFNVGDADNISIYAYDESAAAYENILIGRSSFTAGCLYIGTGGVVSIAYNSGSTQLQLHGPNDDLYIYVDSADDVQILNSQQSNGIVIYDGTGGVGIKYNGTLDWKFSDNQLAAQNSSCIVTVNTIRAQSDTDHKIELDPTADSMYIRPGDDSTDSYIVFKSTTLGSGSPSPYILPNDYNRGAIGTTDIYWYQGYFNLLRYKSLDSFDHIDDIELLLSFEIDPKTKRYKLETIPEFLLNKEELEQNAKNRFVNIGSMQGFILGCIKQLDRKIKELEKIISGLVMK